MKEGGTTASSFQTSMMVGSDVETKYRGLIEISLYKKVRNNLFQLFDYVSFVCPSLWWMHAVMNCFRIFQIFGPVFAARFYDVWGEHSLMKWVNDVVSVAYTYVPASLIDECSITLMFAFSILFILFYILLIASSFYFEKEANLPKFLPQFISIFISTLGYLLPPLATYTVFVDIGNMINGNTQLDSEHIFCIVLVLITIAFYAWLYSTIYSVSITFKPDSLMTTLPSVQVHVCLLNLLNYALMGIGGELRGFPHNLSPAITSISYWTLAVCVNRYGGLVNYMIRRVLVSTAIACGVCLFICGTFLFTNTPANELIILVIVGVWVATFFVYSWIRNAQARKNIELLDFIEEDEENFQYIKSPNSFANIVLDGFRVAHPICLSWSIFKMAVERWPKNVNIWFLYAKFSAIYPEVTQQLDWIAISMIQNKLKGSFAKNCIQQIRTIEKQREVSLVQSLKVKLDRLQKQVQSTKHKVRYIWDLIIQGNYLELENVSLSAKQSVDSCLADFQHLLRMYPNSRFVARLYARFMKDILGDYEEYKIWQQHITNLQRGVSIFPDQANTFGIYVFPSLPRKLSAEYQNSTGLITDDTLTQEIELDEDQTTSDSEMRITMKDNINKLTIPSYKRTRITKCSVFFIFTIVPLILFTILLSYLMKDLLTPLKFLNDITILRTSFCQIIAVAVHTIWEEFTDLPYIELYDEPMPTAFGGTINSREVLTYLVQQISTQMDEGNDLYTYKQGNPQLDAIRDKMYNPSFSFLEYKENMETTRQTISIQESVMKYVTLFGLLNEIPLFTNQTLHTKEIRTVFGNFNALKKFISSVCTSMASFIVSNDTQFENICLYFLIGLLILNVAVHIISSVLCLRSIFREKMMIYQSITSLPKSAISKVADHFKLLKKNSETTETKTSDTRNEDLNKQEENLLKLFTTAADNSRSKTSDKSKFYISTFLIMIFDVIIIALPLVSMRSSSQEISDNAPHIDYMMQSYSNDFLSFTLVIMLASISENVSVPGYTGDRIVTLIGEYQAAGDTAYHAVRYGSPELNIKPFAVFNSTMLHGHLDDFCNRLPKYYVPETFHDVYQCWSPDLLTSYVKSVVSEYAYNYHVDPVKNKLDFADESLADIWHMYFIHLYQNYYYNIFSEVLPSISSSVTDDNSTIIIIIYFVFVFAFFVEIWQFRVIDVSEDRQRFILRLLLHLPVQIVVSNTHLSHILTGNFSLQNVDSTTRDSQFYDNLVKEIPDGVITTDANGLIMTANKATGQIFNINEEELIGKPISEFASKFKAPNQLSQIGQKQLTKEDNISECIVFVKEDGSELHIDTNICVAHDSIIISLCDNTQTVMYNKLITEERNKSDKMLNMILPARLVPRVQAGEQNISFAVQSVSVLFMDIVSFTPWCGNNTAQFVMSTLNKLFKYIDSLVNAHPTMTKIKCIGDCYMAAAGIFAEVNQPAVHAKDIVEFGLEAIEALEKLNAEINQKLQIRVGINTGGPIVAGVFTTGKPTFEILGPTINMAQQMEHHGVPMKVHISRSVYELIYGGSFKIKERGEVEVKKGTVLTYLVEGKK